MKISLVMPTWNGGPLLEQVLRGIDGQPQSADLERIAIDSGSTDGTRDLLASHGFDVHRIDQRDFNHGATRDLGIERSSGELIVLLTQDAVPADNRWLADLIATYDDPRVGAAYCRQIPREDCNPFIAHRIKEWTAGRSERVIQAIESASTFKELAPLERLQLCAYDNVAGSVRRSAWRDHPFGHRQFGEDVAFGKRLVLNGWAIAYEPASAVVHSHNRSPRDEGKRIYCDHQNLKDLFGVHQIPTRANFRGAVNWGVDNFAATVDALQLADAERASLHRWARGYAFWSALGQYWGGNADLNLQGPDAAKFRRIDQWMHHGI